MKLYVLNIKTIIKYSLGALALSVLIILNQANSRTVFMEESVDKLPIYSVNTEEKICAVSFDAAWGAEDTDLLIEILAEHNVKATFFVVGEWVDKYPDEVKKLSEAGHDIMNHSDTHPYMTKIDNITFINEIDNCSKKIEKITNKKVTLFRAPYGDYNSAVIKRLNSMNYYTIQWDVDSLDWKDYGVDSIIKTVTEHKNLQNGSIILMHNGAKYTAEALPKVIDVLKEKGYEIVPISELIYKENYHLDVTGRQIKD